MNSKSSKKYIDNSKYTIADNYDKPYLNVLRSDDTNDCVGLWIEQCIWSCDAKQHF